MAGGELRGAGGPGGSAAGPGPPCGGGTPRFILQTMGEAVRPDGTGRS
ncbi:MAG: hypothetical protein MZU95_13845 [Desulfomicrobium escambiense]|nr:hypothetical protein [Desulfomicrobium escambiense]